MFHQLNGVNSTVEQVTTDCELFGAAPEGEESDELYPQIAAPQPDELNDAHPPIAPLAQVPVMAALTCQWDYSSSKQCRRRPSFHGLSA